MQSETNTYQTKVKFSKSTLNNRPFNKHILTLTYFDKYQNKQKNPVTY